jgi:hypothetical protein
MIIDNPDAVTPAVLDAYAKIADPRRREIVAALIKRLHGFVREVRLSRCGLRASISAPQTARHCRLATAPAETGSGIHAHVEARPVVFLLLARRRRVFHRRRRALRPGLLLGRGRCKWAERDHRHRDQKGLAHDLSLLP